MSLSDLFYLEPYMWLGFGGLAVLLLGLLPAGKKWAYIGTVIVLLGAIISAGALLGQSTTVENFVLINRFTQSCLVLFGIIALAVVFMSRSSGPIKKDLDEIYFSLIIFSVLGMAFIPSDNLIAVLIGIEMVTICGFCLAAWTPSRRGAVEAATKFVVTAGLATGFLLMGIALIYLGSGSVLVSGIQSGLGREGASLSLTIVGLIMLMIGIGFELAVAPFHSWLADLYEGAPAPVVAFIGSIAKLAVLAWLVLLPLWLNIKLWAILEPAIAGLAVISMVVGTVLALQQSRLKRILAYSSVVHFGFILVALAVYQPLSIPAIIYYALGYAVTTIAALAIIIGIEKTEGLSELEHYRGLGRRCPLAGIAFSLVVLSLAGIPPLTGFFAKLMIFQTALNESAWMLAIIMAIVSAAGLYYYIRILLVLFDKPADGMADCASGDGSCTLMSMNTLVIVVFVALTVLLGIFAQPVLHYASMILP